MKLITEQLENVLTETVNTKTGKDYFLTGIFLQSEIVNRNGRLYPYSVLVNEVQKYNQEYIIPNMAYGELMHSNSPQIDMDRISHLIKSLVPEGKNFIGRAKILDTPLGRIVKTLIDEQCKIGVSSRAVGSLEENSDGVQVVQNDFVLSTVDIVATPSAPAAYVRGLVEQKEWVWNNGILTEQQLVTSKKNIDKASRKNLEETIVREFQKFLKKL